jgi:phosphatidylglycerophosphatase A
MGRLLTSCFGLGWLPVAPGTFGSLPPVLLFILMYHFSLPATTIAIVMMILALIGSVICIKFASAAIVATGESDPREIVADEFAGQAATLSLTATATFSNIWVAGLLGFLLFRFFDILKPWPIREIEKAPGWRGILTDDLFAAMYAGITSQVCLLLMIIWRLSGVHR